VLPFAAYERLEKNPKIKTHLLKERLIYFAINNQKFSKNVRLAFNYAIDKNSIINSFFKGLVEVAKSPIPPLTAGAIKLDPYPYDPEKAKTLLAEAGYSTGLKLVLQTTSGRYQFDKEVSEAVQAQLKKIGIDVEVKVMEYATHFLTLRSASPENYPDLAIVGWGTSTGDFDYFARFVYYSKSWPPSGYNPYYKNEKVDELIEIGARETNLEQRLKIYVEAQKLIWDDVPFVYMYIDPTVFGTSSDLLGVSFRSTGATDARYAHFK